jgi:hypothetical protein
MRAYTRAAILTAFGFVSVFFGNAQSQAQNLKFPLTVGKAEYTAVVDAGSSGTRLYLFKVTPGGYPKIEQLGNFENKVPSDPTSPDPDDGIDNYVCGTGFYAPANVNPQVMSLLWDYLKTRTDTVPIPADQIVIKVFATAGMRTAQERCGAGKVDDLYALIKQGMVAAGFTNPLNDARTINGGSEEAVWSFLNVADIYTNSFGDPARSAVPVRDPLGILEVGGSSMQIAYEIGAAGANIYPVSINNRKLNVFGVSYLHLGANDVRKQLRLSQNPERCWAKGFLKANDLGEEEAGYPNLKTNGAFSFMSCTSFMASEVKKRLLLDPQVRRNPRKFVGVSGITYTLAEFGAAGFPNGSPVTLPSKVVNKCTTPPAGYPSAADANEQFACPNGSYISTLLYHPVTGLFSGLPEKFERALINKTDVPKGSLSWIFGYLLLNYSKQ